MADIAPAPGGGGQNAPAQPASTTSTQTPAPAVAQPRTIGVPRDRAEKAAEAAGGTFREPWQEFDPTDAEQSAVAASDPSSDGHPADEAAAAQAPTANAEPPKDAQAQAVTTKANAEALPGDELIAEFDKLAITATNDTAPGSETKPDGVETVADFEKATNPDGKSTPEQRLKHAQEFFGRQSNQIGELKKQLGQREQALKGLADHFELDAKTGQMTASPRTVFELAKAIPQDQFNGYLAEQGLKLVPKDYAGDNVDPVDAAVQQYVNKLKPGEDLEYDEKLAEIEADPKLRKKLDDYRIDQKVEHKLRSEKEQRERTEKESTEKARIEHENAETAQRWNAWMTEAAKLPYFKTELLPAIEHWNPQLPKELKGEARQKVLWTLAQASRFPIVARQIQKSAIEHAEKRAEAKYRAAGGLPSGGENPTYIDASEAPTTNGAFASNAARMRKQAQAALA